jgi:hypothetical protein
VSSKKLAHKLAKMVSASSTRQASRKQIGPAASLLLQVKNINSRMVHTPEASVPTNVSVENQTCTGNDSVSDIGTASEIYLNQQRASDFILGQDHLVAAMNQTVRLELFHQIKFITSPTQLDRGGIIQRWIFKKLNFTEDRYFKEFWNKHKGSVRLSLN